MTAVLSLAVTAPGFDPQAQVVQADAVACHSTASLITERTAYWRAEVERVSCEHVADVREGWLQTVQPMLVSRPGVVITLQAHRSAWITERAWSNGHTERRLESWKRAEQRHRVFVDDAAADCSDQIRAFTEVHTYLLCFERSPGFPPSALPEFLGVWVAHPITPSKTSESALLESYVTSCKGQRNGQ